MSNFIPFKIKICTAIKILRHQTGKNQSDFAEFCNIAYDSLRKWETLKNVPSAENIDKICQANKISVIELLMLTEQEQSDKAEIIKEIVEKLHFLAK